MIIEPMSYLVIGCYSYMTNKSKIGKNDKTFVIVGINGDIGIEFARRFQKRGKIYGISRKENVVEGISYDHVRADFLNPQEVEDAFSKMELSKNVTYVHLPGKFQFQDENHTIVDINNDGIDDDTFATNVETFRMAKPYLTKYLKSDPQIKLKLIAIGSTSDLYDVPYWHSFTQSKNELRKEFREMYGNIDTYGQVSSLFINVSTTDGRQLAGERPHISKEFVLTPKEILDQALPQILDDEHNSLETSILKPHPDFGGDTFLNKDQIRQRWYRDMYGDGGGKQK